MLNTKLDQYIGFPVDGGGGVGIELSGQASYFRIRPAAAIIIQLIKQAANR
jgi:hypothetical protein